MNASSSSKPSRLDSARAAQDYRVPAQAPWSGRVKRGQTIRIVDLEGQQAVDTLFYNAHDFGERYSAQDTVRQQGAAYVGAPVATPLDPRHRLVTTKYNPAPTWTPENAVGIGGA